MTPPPHRPPPPGPRPLPLHLALQTWIALSSQAALPLLKTGSIAWNARLQNRARNLERSLRDVDPEAFSRAVARNAHQDVFDFITGVRAYRDTPRKARKTRGRVIWRRGAARLRDLGAQQDAPRSRKTILLIPSLINRADILDLAPTRSLCRWLDAAGYRPFVLDWGGGGEEETTFSAEQYIVHRLEPAFAYLASQSKGAVHIGGHCMGGLFATALALRNGEACASLSLIATPWDFHAYEEASIAALRTARPLIEAATAGNTPLGVDIIQTLFTSLSPFLTIDKFRRFANAPTSAARREIFVRLEDWLGDGIPLSAPLARQVLFDWFENNTPNMGLWRVGGEAVRPERLTMPVFAAVAERDHIVPAASADALIEKIPHGHRLGVAAGHIGMIAGSYARKRFYTPWTDWLQGLS